MKKSFEFLMLIIFICSCTASSRISLKNIAFLYKNNNKEILKSRLYQKNNQSFICFYEFAVDTLLKVPNEEEKPTVLKFIIYKSYESKQVIDSASVVFDSLDVFLSSGRFDFNLQDTGRFVFNLSICIPGTEFEVNNYQILENKIPDANNYLLMNTQGEVLFNNIINNLQAVRIQYNDPGLKYLFAYFYKRDFPIAAPPFVVRKHRPFNYQPDSIFKIGLQSGENRNLILPQKGFYHFLSDTSQRNGLTLFRFYQGFPQITTAKQMLYPLRYITTRDEYNKMYIRKDKKLAVEEFWLNITGNIVRAQISIKQYYHKVAKANQYFTSYLEGWKTDRGMIYIVFGPPGSVYREEGFETWIYGEEKSLIALVFNFIKVNNPFTENDYRLVRSTKYKENWYFAVDNLRR